MVDDYYAVLGVDRRASMDEIKKAYRRLTLEFHPDLHREDPEMQERYRRINQAYNVLGDAEARSRYDASARFQQLDLSRGFDGQVARDLIGSVFGDMLGIRKRERRRGRDLRYTLSVSLEEAVLGSEHDITFDAPGPCTTCKGTGTEPGGRPPQTCAHCGGRGEVKGDGLFGPRTRCGRCDGTGLQQQDPCRSCRGRGTKRQPREFSVRIPPGTEPGSEKVLKGQGEPGRFGGEAGDLRVTVNVRTHPWLRRDGQTIKCDAFISVSEAALGTRISVPTVDGLVDLEVPPGIKSGTRLRLRRKGVPAPAHQRHEPRGDQLVTVIVETPKVSAPEVRELLEQLEQRVRGTEALPARDEQRRAWADTRRAE